MQFRSDKTIIENKVFNEMINTEISYNKSLKFLDLALFIESQFGECTIINEFQGLVSSLLKVSDSLLANIQYSLQIDDPLQRDKSRTERTELLKTFFELYKNYSQLYNKYTIEFKRDPSPFKRIDYYMIQNSEIKLGFGAHIIMPVQRGFRYLMLVMAIQGNNAGMDQFNQEEFTTLQQMLSEYLTSVNSNMDSPAVKENNKPVVGYQFGDVTRYVLGSLLHSNVPAEKLVSAKQVTESKETAQGYRLGDLTRYYILGQGNTNQQSPSHDVIKTKHAEQEGKITPEKATKPYKFGDYTRGFFNRTDESTIQTNKDAELDIDDFIQLNPSMSSSSSSD